MDLYAAFIALDDIYPTTRQVSERDGRFTMVTRKLCVCRALRQIPKYAVRSGVAWINYENLAQRIHGWYHFSSSFVMRHNSNSLDPFLSANSRTGVDPCYPAMRRIN